MPSEAHARLSHMHPVRLVLLQILEIKSIKNSKTCCCQTAPTLRISAQPQLQCSMFQLCCSQTTLTAGIPGSAEAFCPKLASRWDAKNGGNEKAYQDHLNHLGRAVCGLFCSVTCVTENENIKSGYSFTVPQISSDLRYCHHSAFQLSLAVPPTP